MQLGTSVAVSDRSSPLRGPELLKTNDAYPMRSQIRDGNRQIAGARELAARVRRTEVRERID